MENGSSTSEVEDEEGFVDKDSTGNSLEGGKKRFSRDNTIEEKRRMNKLRRKKKKCRKPMKVKIQQLKKEVSSEMQLRKQAERSVIT